MVHINTIHSLPPDPPAALTFGKQQTLRRDKCYCRRNQSLGRFAAVFNQDALRPLLISDHVVGDKLFESTFISPQRAASLTKARFGSTRLESRRPDSASAAVPLLVSTMFAFVHFLPPFRRPASGPVPSRVTRHFLPRSHARRY
ncbi:hypothetical protein EVAR_19107_1 [Eumeta japonica]|uniref:Uncharacterized protein n=1 Tax=Eumeta variegata TaxID=151549 RepID=A0A4C1UQJ5_EUMVA|nr:hypothetical protein EVAR_19107_1 [Eumeta japonica]